MRQVVQPDLRIKFWSSLSKDIACVFSGPLKFAKQKKPNKTVEMAGAPEVTESKSRNMCHGMLRSAHIAGAEMTAREALLDMHTYDLKAANDELRAAILVVD